LSSHYRQPLDWSTKILEQSKKTLKKFENLFKRIPSDFFIKDLNNDFDNEFLDSLYDDLNTPKALASLNKLFDKVKAFNKGDKEIILSLIKCFKLLGINLNKNNDESDFVTKSEKKIIFDLIKEREEARKLKDYERADNIRDKLKEMNINIEDSLKGTKWIKNE
jgi:cysteinyl-tRNA synthetase